LLICGSVPYLAKCFCAFGHIITVNHQSIQMATGGQFYCTGGILAELALGSVRPQACPDLTQENRIARQEQKL
jgi:hypothetical protein